MFATLIRTRELDHRADDNEEKVTMRLETYDELTKPLLEYYETIGPPEKG